MHRSIEDCDIAISLNPNYYDAYVLKGFVYYNGLNDIDQARQALQTGITLQPKKKIAYLHRAGMLTSIPEYELALDDLLDSAKCDDFIAASHKHDENNKPICCICCCPCQDIIQLQKQQLDADFHLYCGTGHIRYNLRDFKGAYNDFHNAAETIQAIVEVKVNESVNSGKDDKTSEDSVVLLLNQAFCLYNDKEFEKALELLDSCVQMRPSMYNQIWFAIQKCIEELT